LEEKTLSRHHTSRALAGAEKRKTDDSVVVAREILERTKYTCIFSFTATALLTVPHGPSGLVFIRALARDGEIHELLQIDGDEDVVRAATRAKYVCIDGLGVSLKARVRGRIVTEDFTILLIATFPYVRALAKRLELQKMKRGKRASL